MKDQKFFLCKHCGNLIGMINNSGIPMVCCGEKMIELTANIEDASKEKHVPVVKIEENKVEVMVGSVPHPMTPEHSIQWIYLQTDQGGQRKSLEGKGSPSATFCIYNEKPVAVFAYCNLHGLWKTDI